MEEMHAQSHWEIYPDFAYMPGLASRRVSAALHGIASARSADARQYLQQRQI
jgi:hypothetical protein